MKVVAFLPAKGSSERIANKNTQLLNGKPLFLHTLEKLCECDFIDEVYLDSESDEILNWAPYLRYVPLKRDPALATNKTDGHQMFFNEVRQVEADIYIQILCTSPFIEKETIKRGIDILASSERYDSAVLAKKEKQYTWQGSRPAYDETHIPNSVNLPDTVVETMGLYIMKGEAARRLQRRYGNNVCLLEAKPIEAVDVNFPDDFALADIIARGLRQREVSLFRTLSRHLSSPVFSDILCDLGLDTVISGMRLNLPTVKVMGRANTLSLKKLKNEEDFRGIYDALQTYRAMQDGEIIVVENECPELAYFGELNANLAIRSGAICTIIDGVTRDSCEVAKLNYPVFAAGYSCKDVRGRATMASHNQTIHIQGVEINPGDLIFGDQDGIAVIPRRVEGRVLERALASVTTEGAVLSRIVKNEDAFSIYLKEGAF